MRRPGEPDRNISFNGHSSVCTYNPTGKCVPAYLCLIAVAKVPLGSSHILTLVSVGNPHPTVSTQRAYALERLGPRDISRLRLTSKQLSQLLETYFKDLIVKEMPWVCELHDIQTGSTIRRGIDWFALWKQLRVSDDGDCAYKKRRAQPGGDKFHTYDEVENICLRNRRMIHRDIRIILDMMAS